MKTDDRTLVSALRILARDIQSNDGVANACILEGANRLEDLSNHYSDLCKTHEATLKELKRANERLRALQID